MNEQTLEQQGPPTEAELPIPGAMKNTQVLNTLKSNDSRYRRFFEESRNARFIATEDGRLVDINHAGVKTFGFDSREEMLCLGSTSCLYSTQENRTAFQARISLEGFVQDYEIEMQRRDGTRFIGCITANAWTEEDGSVIYEGILRDVTRRRKAEKALLDSDQRIRELNEHILRMLMVMSHDIRGPLVSIGATLKLLLRGTYGHTNESVTNTIRDLLARVVHLVGIAEDCLGKASVVEGSLDMEREVLDLRQDIIDPILDELSGDIQAKQIMIDNRLGAIPAGTIPVTANRVWLKAVYRNLFKNAVKYGGTGCTIAFGFEDHGTFYRLNVYNSGKPVSEEDRERLFTRFGRIADPAAPLRDGVGLGLYLIKEIIQHHGGDIWYEARSQGSDFIFTIPKENVQTECQCSAD